MFVLFLLSAGAATAQDTTAVADPIAAADTLAVDDSLSVLTPPPSSGIDGPIRYLADHIGFSIARQTTHLMGDVKIEYQDVTLTAADVTIDWQENNMIALGVADSTDSLGNAVYRNTPVLTEGSDEPIRGFRLEYNFKNNRGKVLEGRTIMSPGFYRGKNVAKIGQETLLIQDGYFTTCDNEDHPHFYFRAKKMRVRLKKQAVAQPIVLYIADVPIIAAPFGVFSLQRGRRSGILLPTYGETGFGGRFLEDFGYYWAPSDYWDLTLRSTFYEKTGFLYKSDWQYKKRYDFSGYVNATYSPKNVTTGQRGERWELRFKHNQEIGQTLSINGNGTFVSDKDYFRDYSTNLDQRLQQSLTTNVSIRKRLPGSRTLSMNVRRNQNLQTDESTFEFPDLKYTQPARSIFKAKSPSQARWYNDIKYTYNNNLRARRTKDFIAAIDSTETDRFETETKGGWVHNLGMSYNTKVLKYFKLNQSVSFQELWTPYALDYTFDNETNTALSDTVDGFNARRTFSTSLNSSTTFYGLWEIPFSPLKVIRHKVDPQIGFTYAPDFSDESFGYYESFIDTNGVEQRFDRFAGNIFSGTSRGERRSLTIGVNNLFQGKVLRDEEEKKIDLFRVNMNTDYNFARDSLRWNDLSTTLTARPHRNFDLNFRSRHTFYKTNSSNQEIDEFVWNDGFQLPSLLDWNVRINARFSLKPKEDKDEDDGEAADTLGETNLDRDVFSGRENEGTYQGFQEREFEGFNVPWNVDMNFTYSYTESEFSGITRRFDANLSGRVQLTEKWKVRYSARLDIAKRQIDSQTFTINRDLHCWQLNFTWSPNPTFSYYRLEIRVNESALRDLKLTKTAGSRPFF